MVTVRQFYEAPGAPFAVPSSPLDVVGAWASHRERLRRWLRDLPGASWDRPTRCRAWDVSGLVQHLISGSQFLGYTLHQARKGEPTRLLATFDPQATPAAAAAAFFDLGPAELCAALEEVDGRVQAEIDAFGEDDWGLPAEAPPGRVPAYVSVNHFLFDSWVHERDLMVPAGESPAVDPREAAAVTSYVVALAGIAQAVDAVAPAPASFDAALTDPRLDLAVRASGPGVEVTFVDSLGDAPRVEGTVSDLVDCATGRCSTDRLAGDDAPLEVLRNLAALLA